MATSTYGFGCVNGEFLLACGLYFLLFSVVVSGVLYEVGLRRMKEEETKLPRCVCALRFLYSDVIFCLGIFSSLICVFSLTGGECGMSLGCDDS